MLLSGGDVGVVHLVLPLQQRGHHGGHVVGIEPPLHAVERAFAQGRLPGADLGQGGVQRRRDGPVDLPDQAGGLAEDEVFTGEVGGPDGARLDGKLRAVDELLARAHDHRGRAGEFRHGGEAGAADAVAVGQAHVEQDGVGLPVARVEQGARVGERAALADLRHVGDGVADERPVIGAVVDNEDAGAHRERMVRVRDGRARARRRRASCRC